MFRTIGSWFVIFNIGITSLISAEQVREKVRSYRTANEQRILQEFVEFLAIPNVAADRPNIRRNAAKLREMMAHRGIQAQLLEPPSSHGSPAVYGELKTPAATHTLMLYAHYDGQPTDPPKWIDSSPWQPVLRTAAIEAGGKIIPFPKAFRRERVGRSQKAGTEGPSNSERIHPDWRIYARSASDDKAPILAMLTAIDALRALKIPLQTNLKFFFDGEEEAGSPNIEAILRANKDLLRADAWIICDGPVHQSGQKLVYFGVRGVTTAEITIYGAHRDLHSGHYGNWAPNPALLLSRLLASMKDDSGKVLIDGFYDDVEPLGELERKALTEAPAYDQTLMRELGLSEVEGRGKSLVELITLPSLTVNGISSGYVGASARTIIPATATARLDMRLVKGINPATQLERLKAHLTKQGFFVTDREPDKPTRLAHPKIARVTSRGGYPALRTRMDSPFSLKVIETVQSVSERPVVRLPTLGGSVPLSFIPAIFNTPAVGVPIVNYDNNQHSENENVRLQNLWDGIEIMAALMLMREF